MGNVRLEEIAPDLLPDMEQSGKRGIGERGSGSGSQ
jgi:hypothetical protein